MNVRDDPFNQLRIDACLPGEKQFVSKRGEQI